jgi:DNA-binding transcriptional LysR family regulator
MKSLRGIVSFVRTAQLGSFAKAAAELGVSAVAISKSVSRLEHSLGIRLLARSTRHLTLTAEGEAFLDQCREPLQALEHAFNESSEGVSSARGLVRLTAVSTLVHLYLTPLLPDFMARYPEINLDVELSDSVENLIGRRFDIGIRVGALDDSAFIARPLGPIRVLLCAAPAYLKARGIPASIDALTEHSALLLRRPNDPRPNEWWLQNSAGAASSVIAVSGRPRLICNDYLVLHQACIDGMGIAQLPQPLALDALKQGTLRVVLPDTVIERLKLYLHYPSRKHLPSRVRVVVDYLMQAIENHPDLNVDHRIFSASAEPGGKRRQSKGLTQS